MRTTTGEVDAATVVRAESSADQGVVGERNVKEEVVEAVEDKDSTRRRAREKDISTSKRILDSLREAAKGFPRNLRWPASQAKNRDS